MANQVSRTISYPQNILNLAANAKAFRPVLARPGPSGRLLLRRGTLTLLEREALEKFGDGGLYAAMGDMLDDMGVGEENEEWIVSSSERTAALNFLVSNETLRAVYVRGFAGRFHKLPLARQGKCVANAMETCLAAVWLGGSYIELATWIRATFRPLAEALIRGIRLPSQGKKRANYLARLARGQCPEAKQWNTTRSALQGRSPLGTVDTNSQPEFKIPSTSFNFTANVTVAPALQVGGIPSSLPPSVTSPLEEERPAQNHSNISGSQRSLGSADAGADADELKFAPSQPSAVSPGGPDISVAKASNDEPQQMTEIGTPRLAAAIKCNPLYTWNATLNCFDIAHVVQTVVAGSSHSPPTTP